MKVWFFWEGGISPTRKQILEECIKSTQYYNPDREVILVSNTIQVDGVKLQNWDSSLFDIFPDKVQQMYRQAHPRELSDIIRLILLYKYGGSYIDTDDICFKKMSDTPNLVCRSYDPHTAWYNKIPDEGCVSGKYREFRGYDHINMFPRNDCWQNFEPEHPFIKDILFDERVAQKALYIVGDVSFQSLTNEYLKKYLPLREVNYGLTLLYLYEGHVSVSSHWDMGVWGGEMHDLCKLLPDYSNAQHGLYVCEKGVSEQFLNLVQDKYPHASHLWLHDKDQNPNWLKTDLGEKEALSTWIINKIRKEI